ncbi:WW_domain-containing protein [Hexamita inflata]|uniref:WW_domain-containing protein n=1 Tax=Hexamita inflata TaxID=28002 RepID=A0ABP1GKS9_9EUKA
MSVQFQEIDEDWEPNDEEINEYAEYIGIDPKKEPELLFLAKEGLKAPLPPGWVAAKTEDGEVYYQNVKSKEALWDHPCDDLYRQKVIDERTKKLTNKQSSNNVLSSKPPIQTGGSSLLSQISQLQQKSEPVTNTNTSNNTSVKQKPTLEAPKMDLPKFQKDDNFLSSQELIRRQAARAPSPQSKLSFKEDDDEPEVVLSRPDSQQPKPAQTSVVHNDEFQTQQRQNSQEILRITSQHAEEVRKIIQQQADECTAMNRKHYEKVSQIMQDNQKELKQIQQKHDEDVQQLRQRLQQEYSQIQNQVRIQFESQLTQSLQQSIKPQDLQITSNDQQQNNSQLNSQLVQAQAKNALLQQQIIDAEKISIERHKQLHQLQNEIDSYSERINQLQFNTQSLKEEYSQTKNELQTVQTQLNEAYKQKQYTINQVQQTVQTQNQNFAQVQPQQMQGKTLITLCAIDAFTAVGTALIYALCDPLRYQMLNEKQFTQCLYLQLQSERNDLDLRIKSLEAKRNAFQAESRVINNKEVKTNLINQRKQLDQEGQIVQNMVKTFKESQDFIKKRKQYLSALLTTVINSLQGREQILQLATQFVEKNNINYDDLTQNALSLDQSNQFDSLFEQLRFQVSQHLQAEEVRRISLIKEGFYVRTDNFEQNQMKIEENNMILSISIPTKIAQMISRQYSQNDLVYEDFQVQPFQIQPSGNAPWIDGFRKGLK